MVHVHDIVQNVDTVLIVFSRNLATARFNFKALWRQFEGSIYRDRHARTYTALIINLFVCTYNVHAHTHIVVNPVPCSKILRAAFIGMSWLKYAATF